MRRRRRLLTDISRTSIDESFLTRLCDVSLQSRFPFHLRIFGLKQMQHFGWAIRSRG